MDRRIHNLFKKQWLLRISYTLLILMTLVTWNTRGQSVTTIEMDSKNLVIPNVVAFDMPFIVKIPLKAETKDIIKIDSVWIWKYETKFPKITSFEDIVSKGVLEKAIGLDGKTETERLKIINNNLHIQLEPLNANRFYQFAFQMKRDLSKEEILRYRKMLSQKIDKELRKGKIGGMSFKKLKDGATFKEFKKLQREIRTILKNAVSDNELRIKIVFKDTFLDPEKSDGTTALKLYEKTIDQTIIRNNEIDKLKRTWKSIIKPITNSLVTSKKNMQKMIIIYDELLRAFKDHVSNQLTQELVQSLKLAYNLATLPEANCLQIALGLETLQVSKNDILNNPEEIWNDIWEPSQLTPLISNLQTTSSSLKQIKNLIYFVQNCETIKINHMLRKKHLKIFAKNLSDAILEIDSQVRRYYDIKCKLQKRQNELNESAKLTLTAVKVSSMLLSTRGEFKTRANWYISADAGFLYAFGVNEIKPYLGVNIYFSPLNKDVPVEFQNCWKRFALTIGVTVSSVKVEGKRDNLFGNRALVVGFGYRVFDVLRFTSGLMIFKKEDPNPLVTNKDITIDPFISLSLDWDVKSTLGNIGNIFQ